MCLMTEHFNEIKRDGLTVYQTATLMSEKMGKAVAPCTISKLRITKAFNWKVKRKHGGGDNMEKARAARKAKMEDLKKRADQAIIAIKAVRQLYMDLGQPIPDYLEER